MTMTPGFPERGGFADRFRRIERRMRALESAPRSAISGDGRNAYLRRNYFDLSDEGAFRILDDDGNVLARFDKDSIDFYDTSGTLRAQLDTGDLTFWNAAGSLVWSSAQAWSAWVASDTDAQASSASSAWVGVATFHGPIESPDRCIIPIDVRASSPGTTGEVRLVQDDVAGTVIDGPTEIIGFGGSGVEYTDYREASFADHDVDTWPAVTVQVRRSGGTGTVYARCRRPAGWA